MRRVFDATLLAFTFFTRLPVPLRLIGPRADIRDAATAGPLVGVLIGAVLVAGGWLGWVCRAPIGAWSLGLLAGWYAVTGFLHFDGLCDVADAGCADRSPDQRLVILKDSRLGSFALGVGILVVIGKWEGLGRLLEGAGNWRCLLLLLAVPTAARSVPAMLAWRGHYPRDNGTAAFLVGRIGVRRLLGAVLITTCVCAVVVLVQADPPGAALTMLVGLAAMFATVFAFRCWSERKFGGITGDVIGAAIELAELAMLVGMAIGIGVRG